jgi:hypothetical protein
LAEPKPLGITRADLLKEIGADGTQRGQSGRWMIDVFRAGRFIMAKLTILETIVVGLDYHSRQAEGHGRSIIPPQWYHWDVHPPFCTAKTRLPGWHAPRPSQEADDQALAAITGFWNLVFEDHARRGKQDALRWGTG